MLIVAGLSLKNLKPRVWDPSSPFYLPGLQAVMVSYADFHRMPARKRQAMETGLRACLGVGEGIAIYLDNGAFHFASRKPDAPPDEYEEFVEKTRPDWYPIPQDYIPSPSMSRRQQRDCFDRTMAVNRRYQHDGYVPVVHIGRHVSDYVAGIVADDRLSGKHRAGGHRSQSAPQAQSTPLP
jgi:hypothetical protein